MREDGRNLEDLRDVNMITGVQGFAEGSVIIETGLTRVLCSVSLDEDVPHFLRGTDKGWLTAEYSMLPRSTMTRTPRETRPKGRTQEIQRLIGRSLRSALDLNLLGELTLTVDCDVLQADGGTRTAAITGGYVALEIAIANLISRKVIKSNPIRRTIAATSVGLVDGDIMLDLNYEEDHRADVDFNIVMTDKGEFIELQGTAEAGVFSRTELDQIIALGEKGLAKLFKAQKQAISKT